MTETFPHKSITTPVGWASIDRTNKSTLLRTAPGILKSSTSQHDFKLHNRQIYNKGGDVP